MSSEKRIFSELEELCAVPGYLEVIAAFSFKDTFTHQKGEVLGIEDILSNFNYERLSRTELSTLIGLCCKNGIIDKKLSQEETQGYMLRTVDLMSKLHDTFYQDFSFSKLTSEQQFFTSSSIVREAIFYAGDGVFKHQYRDLIGIRYSKDDAWINENKGFSISNAVEVFNLIDSITVDKANRINKLESNFLSIFQFSIDDILSRTNLNIEIIRSVLSSFSSLPQEGMEVFTTIDSFNPRNAFPIINLENDNFISFQSYSLWESLYESPFFWFNSDKSYKQEASKNRGQFTEDYCAARLETVFKAGNVYKNIDVYQGKTRVSEIDVLVVFGDYALVVQAKSKKLTIEARKGNSNQLKSDFKAAVQDAYDQALICSKLLQQEDVVYKQGDRIIDLKGNKYKDIFPICVVSDYYPALATQSREFLNFEVTNVIKHPYVMDVFLVDLICEMLDSPLFLLDYLIKRCDFGHVLLSNHELNILSTYITHNLYFESNPSMIFLEESLSGELELALLARRENFNLPKTPNGILTLENKYSAIGKIFKELKFSNKSEKQNLGFLLLSLSEETLSQLDSAMKHMIKAFSKGKKHSDLTIGLDGSSSGLTIHCNDESLFESINKLIDHCKKRKYLMKADSWIGLLISPSDLTIRFIYLLNEVWEKSDDLEKLIDILPNKIVKTSKLNGARNLFLPTIAKTPKIGRNEKCFCNSGKKYKHCCLN